MTLVRRVAELTAGCVNEVFEYASAAYFNYMLLEVIFG